MPNAIGCDFSDPMQRRALETIGENVNCGMLLRGERGSCATLYVNERCAQYWGCSPEAFAARYPRYFDAIDPDDREHVKTAVALALDRQDSYDLIYRVRRGDGGVAWIRENGRRVTSPGRENLLLCVMVDITGDMASRQEIEAQRKADPLTKVLSETAFLDQTAKLLSATLQGDRRHALIVLDIDQFQRINDTFGRGFGDKVLEDVADSLKAVIRAGDLLGRLGGDEFVLCLRDIKADKRFDKRMEVIRALLHRQLPGNVELSSSLGVAIYRQDGADVASLYRHAKSAMGEAKRRGGNLVAFYSPELE